MTSRVAATATATATTCDHVDVDAAWLRPISDMYRQMNKDGDDDDDDDDDEDVDITEIALPVCAPDCTDGEAYYRTLGAWCVPWPQVPKTLFLKAWFALPAVRRCALVSRYMFYAEELGEDHAQEDQWWSRMFARDDADMLRALYANAVASIGGGSKACGGVLHWPPPAAASVTRRFPARECIRHGAVQCLVTWAQLREWSGADCAKYAAALGACEFSAGAGHLAMLKLLHANGVFCRGAATAKCRCTTVAAAGGHLACLAYLCERGCPWDDKCSEAAAKNGHTHCLRYICESVPSRLLGGGGDGEEDQRRLLLTAQTSYWAARNGHLESLKYLHEHGCPWSGVATQAAAMHGHIDCLVYAHEHGCSWNASACAAAASNGSLACLVYMHERGCPWTVSTCTGAARNGRLACLQYAHEQDCPWASETTCAAARHGHLACLVYAHEQGCPWDSHTTAAAAECGHLDCLVYAHEHGCPWDSEYSYHDGTPVHWYNRVNACIQAANHGQFDCLRYAHQHGCPYKDRMMSMYSSHPACNRYIDIIRMQDEQQQKKMTADSVAEM